jgi:hypothetical protein
MSSDMTICTHRWEWTAGSYRCSGCGCAGRKDDASKLRYSLLPWRGLEEVVRVLEHGAALYGEESWRQVPDARRRYLDAALRHLVSELAGVRVDEDSQRRHAAHAVASLLFVLEVE